MNLFSRTHSVCGRRFWLAVLPFFLAACSSLKVESDNLDTIPVQGKVLLDDKPLEGAVLKFVPTGNTPGQGGFAQSDKEGAFTVTYNREQRLGLPPGEYRVSVSRRLMPDGSPVPANDPTPPIESPAKESIPAKFNDAPNGGIPVSIKKDASPLELRVTSK